MRSDQTHLTWDSWSKVTDLWWHMYEMQSKNHPLVIFIHILSWVYSPQLNTIQPHPTPSNPRPFNGFSKPPWLRCGMSNRQPAIGESRSLWDCRRSLEAHVPRCRENDEVPKTVICGRMCIWKRTSRDDSLYVYIYVYIYVYKYSIYTHVYTYV